MACATESQGANARTTSDGDDAHSHLCRNRRVSAFVLRHAKVLRHDQTAAEQVLWARLRRQQLGVRFRRQHAIGRIILDFYCPQCRLGIEVDGGIHARRDVRRRDAYKAEVIVGSGIRLLRFSNADVLERVDDVMRRICQAIAATPE